MHKGVCSVEKRRYDTCTLYHLIALLDHCTFFLSFCIVDGYHDGGSLVGYSVIVEV